MIIFLKIEVVPIMLFVVVSQVVGHPVGLSMFLLPLVHLVLHDILALPCHLNQFDELLPDVL